MLLNLLAFALSLKKRNFTLRFAKREYIMRMWHFCVVAKPQSSQIEFVVDE